MKKKQYKKALKVAIENSMEFHKSNKVLCSDMSNLLLEHATCLSELDQKNEEIKRLNKQIENLKKNIEL
jgi:hypothetical protein